MKIGASLASYTTTWDDIRASIETMEAGPRHAKRCPPSSLPAQPYEQAGITWYSDGKPVFKEVKELLDGELYIIPGRQPMPAKSVRLRLLVTADSWEAQYRPEDATEFQTAATGDLPSPGDDQVSILCYNGPADTEHWIRFENFRIKSLT